MNKKMPLFLLFFFILLTSCGDGTKGIVPIHLNLVLPSSGLSKGAPLRAADIPVTHLILQVAGPGMETIFLSQDIPQMGEVIIDLNVPAGLARRFTVTAFDINNNPIFRGEALVNLSPGASSIVVTIPLIAILQSIAVTPTNPSVAVGFTQQFTAIGTFSDNSTSTLATSTIWASSDTSVATINAESGMATGVTVETTTITARLGNISGTTTLTVNAAPDTTAPTVSSTSPLSGLSNMATTTAITAIFSEAIATSTITTGTFTLSNGATGTVAYNATTKVATFTPSANLLYGTAYTATITGGGTGVKDVAGNPLASNYVWSFTTAVAPPSKPTGLSATAGNGQVTLAWSANASTKNVTSYTLYMASQSGVTASNYAGLTEGMKHTDVVTPYTHTGLTSGTQYYFVLTATNAGGESASSDEATATPLGFAAQAYLKAPNAEAYDQFGISVAVSGDTVAVGAFFEDSNQTTVTNGQTASTNNSANGAGAVYIFRRTGVTWAQEAYLKAPNAGASDQFGISVAVSGDTVAVGAYLESSNQTTITNGQTASADNSVPQAGAVYIFRRTGVTWAQEAYLKAPNAEAYDYFAISVAVSGDMVAVGASGEDSNQTTITDGKTASPDNSASSAGAVYIFRRTGVTWAQEAYLKAPNAGASDQFGVSVAVSGDTVAVGAHLESSNQTTITNGQTASADNSVPQAGAVYIFRRTGVTWAQEAYLKAPNAGADDNFGVTVAVLGDTVAVGARFESSNQTTITNGETASADNSAANAGAVYIFRRTGVTWAQEAYLKAPNAEAGDVFGYSVAVSGDTVAVGAHLEDSNQTTITNGQTAIADNSALNAGAVYIFRRTGGTWAQEAYLKAPNAEAYDYFGVSVAVSGDTVAVGAFGQASNQTTITNGKTASADNSAPSAGAVYIFVRQ
jgi:hypothetical protein